MAKKSKPLNLTQIKDIDQLRDVTRLLENENAQLHEQLQKPFSWKFSASKQSLPESVTNTRRRSLSVAARIVEKTEKSPKNVPQKPAVARRAESENRSYAKRLWIDSNHIGLSRRRNGSTDIPLRGGPDRVPKPHTCSKLARDQNLSGSSISAIDMSAWLSLGSLAASSQPAQLEVINESPKRTVSTIFTSIS